MDNFFRPWWTKRKVLICFLVFFVGVIAILEVILRISDDRQGLGMVQAGQHYLWVYGPTASK